MANEEQIKLLKAQGVSAWNKWRYLSHPESMLDDPELEDADLSHADLSGLDLSGIDCRNANLSFARLKGSILKDAHLGKANLNGADLEDADLTGASLANASLIGANLKRSKLNKCYLSDDIRNNYPSRTRSDGANLANADLSDAELIDADLVFANLFRTNLTNSNLTGADLYGANLKQATLVRTNLTGCSLTWTSVYGISVWDAIGTPKDQNDILITSDTNFPLRADNLRVAQFLHLMLDNKELRDVLDTITSKVVLILGRFSDPRKKVLDAIRDALRARNYTPVLFDFEGPSTRNLTETITLLARMARFIIADLTEPSSIPHELHAIVPDLPSVPVSPLLLETEQGPYAMFEHLQRYPWMLPIYKYNSADHLISTIDEEVVKKAEQKREELFRK